MVEKDKEKKPKKRKRRVDKDGNVRDKIKGHIIAPPRKTVLEKRPGLPRTQDEWSNIVDGLIVYMNRGVSLHRACLLCSVDRTALEKACRRYPSLTAKIDIARGNLYAVALDVMYDELDGGDDRIKVATVIYNKNQPSKVEVEGNLNVNEELDSKDKKKLTGKLFKDD